MKIKDETAVILIGKHKKVTAELKKRGIRCITLEDNDDIDFSVRNHADMAAYMLGGRCVLLDKRQTSVKYELEGLGYKVILTDEKIIGDYPDDIKFNAAKVGNSVICLEKYISPEIISDAYDIINVKQGYAKCSVCVVNDNAFITDDAGIYEKCKERFDVLLIEKGDILLEGKNYGFIGGASGILNGRIYFFGSLDFHRDGDKIKAFLEKHNAAYECLFDGKLVDIGGFFEIKQAVQKRCRAFVN